MCLRLAGRGRFICQRNFCGNRNLNTTCSSGGGGSGGGVRGCGVGGAVDIPEGAHHPGTDAVGICGAR